MNMRQELPLVKRVKRATKNQPLYLAFQEFVRLEASGGIVLLIAALVALFWANSPWAESYFDLWHLELAITTGNYSLAHDLHWWINEALMVVFFFVVGLEIKREVIVGQLSSVRQATLPIAAAVGGMLLPALFYFLINRGTDGLRGWGVPMATDIAFALGVMALVGSSVPLSLKIFLTALAIVDDIGAVLVIALFYSGEIGWAFVWAATGVLFLLILANQFGARSPILYSLLGIALWLAILYSGLHATLAGVILAATIPAHAKIDREEYLKKAKSYIRDFENANENDKTLLTHQQNEALQLLEDATQEAETPLQRLEHALHPWVTYAIIPLFALANAGVSLRGGGVDLLVDRVSLGVIVGLVLGKQLGVFLAAWLAVKAKLADLPANVSWKQIYGTGWIAGIGFTMALFISALAFAGSPEEEAAKVGILAASLVASLGGYIILKFFAPKAEA